jgi:hypothetical protein
VQSQDVVIEVDARQSGSPSGYTAVICRWQNQANYTAFAVNGENQFAVWQKQDGQVSLLYEWRNLPAAAREQQRLRLLCQGTTLRFVVADIVLAEVNDPNPASGDIAFLAGMAQPGEYTARFDNLLVTRP